jgi:hypothetical protein
MSSETRMLLRSEPRSSVVNRPRQTLARVSYRMWDCTEFKSLEKDVRARPAVSRFRIIDISKPRAATTSQSGTAVYVVGLNAAAA